MTKKAVAKLEKTEPGSEPLIDSRLERMAVLLVGMNGDRPMTYAKAKKEAGYTGRQVALKEKDHASFWTRVRWMQKRAEQAHVEARSSVLRRLTSNLERLQADLDAYMVGERPANMTDFATIKDNKVLFAVTENAPGMAAVKKISTKRRMDFDDEGDRRLYEITEIEVRDINQTVKTIGTVAAQMATLQGWNAETELKLSAGGAGEGGTLTLRFVNATQEHIDRYKVSDEESS